MFAATPVDCGPNSTQITLLDRKGNATGSTCGTDAAPCPAGYTFDAGVQGCRENAIYQKWQFWAVVAGSVAVISTGAVLIFRRRR